MPKFPVYLQHDANNCGPSCLQMIAKFYGKTFNLETLRTRCFINRTGVSLQGISEAAESIGFRTKGVMVTFHQLSEQLILPCIAHWHQDHFVVVIKISKGKVYVADPAFGTTVYTKEEFLRSWGSTSEGGETLGVCMQLEPTPEFYRNPDEKLNRSRLKFLFNYVSPYRSLILQITLGVFLGAFIQVIFPFLFQTIVDKGIIIPNHSLLVTVLIAQLVLVASRFSIEFIRNWIILHLGSRVNIYLVSDFLMKLMRMPMSFFESKNRGDLLQRVADHKRIEVFLTRTTINLFYSVLSMTIMGIVLLIFSWKIFLIYLTGSAIYLLWTLSFMKQREELDNKTFAQLSNNQNSLIQLISGMHEIKMNNCEKRKQWEWEDIQAKIFSINIKGLTLVQKQKAGALIFNQFKDVLIVFFTAWLVLQGKMTLGSLVAVSYIIGQLSGPIDMMIEFLHTTQDARNSLRRLSEIHNIEDEAEKSPSLVDNDVISGGNDIEIRNLSFQYEGPQSPFVLKEINLNIPFNKTTAIVGASGSGKTTLIKLLLKFYDTVGGDILIGTQNLKQINPSSWRSICGVVMQDGYLFSDTIANNIALSEETINKEKLFYAARIANVTEITDNLPLGFNTKIGIEGMGLSQGQKQRILIARALYKDPAYLFFDEATNSLDANNERAIIQNLYGFFKGRTVIVVAHRLSTVKNADKIVVLDNGNLVETGTHTELSKKKGAYYSLVRNQLELGN